MSIDKFHGKGGSYVRLPDGSRVTALDAKRLAEKREKKDVELSKKGDDK